MQVGKPLFNNIPGIKIWLTKIYNNILAGKVDFRNRDGTIDDNKHSMNMNVEWQRVTDTGSADTEFTVNHTLGRVPVGYIVVRQDKAGSLYESSFTSWTNTSVTLKFSTTNTAITIGLF